MATPEEERAQRILWTNPHAAARDEAHSMLGTLNSTQFPRPSERDRAEKAAATAAAVGHTPDCAPGNRCDGCKAALAQRVSWSP